MSEAGPGAGCLVGMSGGVDSSVSALLVSRLTRACGATLLLAAGAADERSRRNVSDARAVCDVIGIEHVTVDALDHFSTKVEARFADEYRAGRTPNPCVDCNRLVKFPDLLAAARSRGLSHVASGHYARITQDARSGRWQLSRGRDVHKDQSYMLYGLTQDMLAHTLLPLGDRSKDEVRAIAREGGLPVAEKPESQDICFIPSGDYVRFLEGRAQAPAEPGRVTDVSGRILGEHDGLWSYTVGQRRGIGIPSSEPYYVVAKDVVRNVLVVGRRKDCEVAGCIVFDVNWVSVTGVGCATSVEVKTRYRQRPVSATLTPGAVAPQEEPVWRRSLSTDPGDFGRDETSCAVTVVFDEPLGGVAPGQACVFYRGDLVLGGGTIGRTFG